jgi:DNA-binding CsgD family transcriptional regulator
VSVRVTPRERQVICTIAYGLTQPEAGDALGISASTVKMHDGRLRAKLGVRRREMVPAAFLIATGEDPMERLEGVDLSLVGF